MMLDKVRSLLVHSIRLERPAQKGKTMATKTKPHAAPPERADLLEKEPRELHELFAEYVQEQTGCSEEEFSARAAQLAYALMGHFQKSPANQDRIARSRDARAATVSGNGDGEKPKRGRPRKLAAVEDATPAPAPRRGRRQQPKVAEAAF